MLSLPKTSAVHRSRLAPGNTHTHINTRRPLPNSRCVNDDGVMRERVGQVRWRGRERGKKETERGETGGKTRGKAKGSTALLSPLMSLNPGREGASEQVTEWQRARETFEFSSLSCPLSVRAEEPLWLYGGFQRMWRWEGRVTNTIPVAVIRHTHTCLLLKLRFQ